MISLNRLKAHISSKPMLCHFYETAMTTKALLDGYFSRTIKKICSDNDIDEDNFISMILFFSFLHDVGMIHPAFQYKLIPEILDDFGYEYEVIYDGFRHEMYSKEILDKFVELKAGKLSPRNLVSIMTKAVACHHQGKTKNISPIPSDFEAEWENMQDDVINIASSIFHFDFVNKNLREPGNGVFEIVAGIINLSDWIASTQDVYDDVFPSEFPSSSSEFFDGKYGRHLSEQCDDFLRKNKMDGESIHSLFHFPSNYWDILLNGSSPRPMQSVVADIADKTHEPSLLFIEDASGGGKKEAALYYALKTNPNASGIYVALPTNEKAVEFQKRVSQLFAHVSPDYKIPLYTPMAWIQNDDVNLNSSFWQSESKLKMFYPSAVGTVDQLLMSVQAVKYSDLALIALANKVLIIDEMHAYDAYMLEEFKTLFGYCSMMGVTIIVLSATMPEDTKRQLIVAYNNAKLSSAVNINGTSSTYEAVPFAEDYPLITKVSSGCITETVCEPNVLVKYDYQLIGLNEDSYCEALFSKTVNTISCGGNASVVMNTVQRSIEFYSYAKDKIKEMNLDIDVYLLHSRFSLSEKQNKINNVLKLYGKDRSNRPKKSIFVSTQIIEQLMDVDFDFMFTEIAPIDLLIQRFGRVRRHSDKGTIRETTKVTGPSVCVFTIGEDFDKSKFVYDKSILSASYSFLSSRTELCAPNDIRQAVETVYAPENVNLWKNSSLRQNAKLRTIGTATSPSFWLYVNISLLDDVPCTRFNDRQSTGIILLDDEQESLISDGYEFSTSERREIVKHQMYSSIPLDELEGKETLKMRDRFFWGYKVYSQKQFTVSEDIGLVL